jgi:hypothetical protein
MEASRKTKLPVLHKLGYTPTMGTLGNCLRNTIRRMPGDRTLLSLNTSLAIPTRVSAKKLPGALRPQTGQTGFTNRSRKLWLSRVTQWFYGEPLQTLRT